tara:strand:- start:4659 stop:7985 length:3327 start_codon:yes stop_codon:yes gene_type:complete
MIDSGFVVNYSMRVNNYESDYFKQISNKLVWLKESPSDSIDVIYKRLYFVINYSNKNKESIYNIFRDNPFKYTPNKNEVKSNYGKLNTMGNISRGIGIGNSQNVVINSNLNLRLDGKLAEDIEIFAVISDENNPIQPEGNTQQIQDFDQVYITLKKDSLTLTFGDFLMKSQSSSYFLKYYKKSRGIQLKNASYRGDWKIKTNAEVAISRGRFSRNRINGIEGNSGPYRLNGDNGENFIIVIAGTEVVYLNGKKLTRGEGHDYVINYNTGEVTFTPKVLITAYSRIVVEFQYADRNYGRTVSSIGTELSKGKFSFYANGFNEMDLKSQPFLQTLSDTAAKIDALRMSGDQLAIYENVRLQKSYNPDRIMYKKEIMGAEEIFVYASDPTEDLFFYEVFFSNVGYGNGSYSQSVTGANGKVFEYVGYGFGNYEPFEVLASPKRLNTANFGFSITEKNRKMGLEYVISSMDNNTFSTRDDNDNFGSGLKIYQTALRPIKYSSLWTLKTELDYEMITKNYDFVERYRDVEFDRNWNKILSNPAASSQLIPALEHIGNLSLKLYKSERDFISNQTELFYRKGNFNGLSNKLTSGFLWNDWSIRSELDVFQSESFENDTSTQLNQFYSFRSSIIKSSDKFTSGLNYNSELSRFNNNDTVLFQSYKFNSYDAFIKSTDTSKIQYQLKVGQRIDNRPKNNGFKKATIGRNITFDSRYAKNSFQRIAFNTTFRQLEIKDSTLSSKEIENTLQSRIELDLHLFKRFIRSKTFYQIGTGQEQRREFQYLQVQSGNGIYIWNDYDSNGLKTLNEFELASELDKARADYIKIFTPVAGFITTNSTKVTQTLELNPAVFISKNAKKKAFIGRFNSFSTLMIDKKVLPRLATFLINPLNEGVEDTSLINQSQNFRTTLFFNRGNSKYSLDYTFLSGNSKVLLTNGFDSRLSQSHVFKGRYSLSRLITVSAKGSFGNKIYLSEFFGNRIYDYDYFEIQPVVQLVLGTSHRIEIKSKIFDALNANIYGGEKSRNIEFGGEYRYTKASKGALNIGMNFINVDYKGTSNSTLGYELLRGLQNGSNLTWKLNYQQTMSNNIQITISYDGRSSETSDVIHIGRVVARYLF